jgi:hypothetical protein
MITIRSWTRVSWVWRFRTLFYNRLKELSMAAFAG